MDSMALTLILPVMILVATLISISSTVQAIASFAAFSLLTNFISVLFL
ncbi:MAG: hypothetical protein ABIB93_06270 [Chloroflexota bacterium]